MFFSVLPEVQKEITLKIVDGIPEFPISLNIHDEGMN